VAGCTNQQLYSLSVIGSAQEENMGIHRVDEADGESLKIFIRPELRRSECPARVANHNPLT
jgi:hypothetical protein